MFVICMQVIMNEILNWNFHMKFLIINMIGKPGKVE